VGKTMLYAAAVIAGLLWWGLMFGAVAQGVWSDDRTQKTCWEDQPCWDCRTMGNRICGPGAGG
jgi:hypothetical protein